MLGYYSYKRWFIVSASFHLTIIFAILIGASIYRFMSRPVFISGGIGSAEPINIDVVGLPNVLKKDLPLLNKSVTEEKAPKKEEMAVLEKKNEKENEKVVEKKNNLIAKVKDSVDQEENYLTKIKIIKGLKQQKGAGGANTTNSGIGVSSDAVQANPYFQTIKEYVKNYWKIPNWINAEGLNTLVTLKISDDGNISDLTISKGSGNPEFDDLALNSVKNAAPFPPPPIAVRETLESGVILSFP
jgi:TolA protein